MKLHNNNIALYSLLIALSLTLSFFEGYIPIPLPGVKLGLANIITLFSLYTLGPIPSAIILLCRCILASFFSGSIISLLFSVSGGACALAIMLIFKCFQAFSIYGISIAGAAAHSVGQILIACILFSSVTAIYYLPALLISSLITGTITAFISEIMLSRLKNVFFHK